MALKHLFILNRMINAVSALFGALQNRLPLILNKFPAGATWMSMCLYALQIAQGSWSKMDYDEFPQMGLTNIEAYNKVLILT